MRIVGALAFAGLVACSGAQPTALPAPPEADVNDASSADASSQATANDGGTTTPSTWDSAKLEELAAYAESKSTKALLLVAGGETVLERYFGGAGASSTQDVYSVQKSVTATLAMIAIEKGLFAIEDTVTSILGVGWSNAAPAQEEKVTVRHLLTMTSGLGLKLGFLAEPGTSWLYNDDAFYRVRLVLEKKTGKELDAVAHEWLFDRVGMTSSKFRARLTKDSKDLPIVGLQTSARDLAIFGGLLRAHGTWNGTSIVSASSVDEMTKTSQPLNESYGLLFWLNGKSGGLLPFAMPFTGPLVPSAPADAFAALGKDDQKMYVARSLDLVVVRLGGSAGDSKNALSSFDDELWKRIVAAKPAQTSP